MPAPTRMYMIRGIAAARAGDYAEARRYLERLLILGGTAEEEAEALLWLSRIETDPAQKREYLERLLSAHPHHVEGRRELALLQGELAPEEIINPDQLEAAPAGPLLCPQCGSALAGAAEGTERLCPLCGWSAQVVPEALPAADAEALLRQGIAAARGGDTAGARQAFTRIINHKGEGVPPGVRVQAWLWLSGLTDDLEQRRRCLEAALRLDPDNRVAQQGLALLEGQATPATPQAAAPEVGQVPAMLKARRIVCPKCGGSMTGRGTKVHCDYCGYERPVLDALRENRAAEEQNFVVALATARGHRAPTGVGVLRCQACGAQYLLLASQLTVTCAYCGSPHVTEAGQMSLVTPHGVIPMEVTRAQAEQALQAWFEVQGLKDQVYLASLQGAFVPLWTFDFGGELTWRCYVVKRQGRYGVMRYPMTGEYPLLEDDVRVPASHTLPAGFNAVFGSFDTNAAKPFAPEFVASWLVEIYQVTVSDASIAARELVWRRRQRDVRLQVELRAAGAGVEGLTISTLRMAIQSYKLVLVPLWVARYRPVTGAEGEAGYVVVQGQSGEVFAPRQVRSATEEVSEAVDGLLDSVKGLFRGRKKKAA